MQRVFCEGAGQNAAKRAVCGVFALTVMMVAAACSSGRPPTISPADAGKRGSTIKAGLVTNKGGFGDKSYHDLQYNGVVQARARFGVDFAYEELKDGESYFQKIEVLIARQCNVIFCSSIYTQAAVEAAAGRHPDVKFVVMDTSLASGHPNVANVLLRQNEGSFLAGALAAMMSRTGVIAIITGRKEDIIDDFICGYKAGAAYVSPEVRVIVVYLSDRHPSLNPWMSPREARSLALEAIGKDRADVIFGVAGASNLGVFQACADRGAYAIGVDADQDYLMKGVILTSMMKRTDRVIMAQMERITQGRFQGGVTSVGLADGCVDLSPMTYTRDKIGPARLRRLEEIRAGIVAGAIQVPTAVNFPVPDVRP